MKISTTDLHWLAGWLEGEGSFSRCSVGKASIRVGGDSTDRDVIQRVATLTDIKVYAEPRGKNKIMYRFVVVRHAAGWMMTLYTLMGVRRKARIAALLHLWRNNGYCHATT